MNKNLKFYNIILYITLAVFTAFSFSSCAGIQGSPELPVITIVNNTGSSIWYIFISEITSFLKGDDWLDSDQIVGNGQSVKLKLMYPLDRVNVYSIKLVDSEGNLYIKTEVPVSNDSRIVFTSSDLMLWQHITIENNTGFTIWNVLISETASNSWGSDWLEQDEVFYNGDSVSFDLLYSIDEVSRYDIMLIAQNENKYIKMNVPVTGNDTISFTQNDRQY